MSQRIFIAHIVCRFNCIYVLYCSPDLITDNQLSYYPLSLHLVCEDLTSHVNLVFKSVSIVVYFQFIYTHTNVAQSKLFPWAVIICTMI